MSSHKESSFEDKDDDDDERKFSKKKTTNVWLVRHGQSLFNEKMDTFFENNKEEKKAVTEDPYTWWERDDHYDPMTHDAELTRKGLEQASNLGEKLKNSSFDLIVVSPLSRAIQTCQEIIKVRSKEERVIVHPLACERVNSSCDVGSSVICLKKKFPSLDFSTLSIGKNWHENKTGFSVVPNASPPKIMESLPEFSKRIDSFKSWLRSRPERDICVVCHAVVIHEFTETWVQNCSVTKVTI